MPTYEYECGTCGTFEQFQRITEDPLSDCPRCGSAVRRLISSGTGIIFKGSGFYSTDSRASGKSDDGGQSNDEDGKGKEASKADGESAGKDSSAGESKSDSKSDPTSDTSTKTKKKEPAAATAAKD